MTEQGGERAELAEKLREIAGSECRFPTGVVPLDLLNRAADLLSIGSEPGLRECEEALRSTEAEFAAFRERTLKPLQDQGGSIESLSWDDLLGVAVRNLNEAMRLDTLVRRAAPFVNAVAAMADDKTPALAWLADAAPDLADHQPPVEDEEPKGFVGWCPRCGEAIPDPDCPVCEGSGVNKNGTGKKASGEGADCV